MAKMMTAAVLAAALALFASACGKPDGGQKSAAEKTAGTVDRVAAYATGQTPLEQKKKVENRLNQIQQKRQKELEDALQ